MWYILEIGIIILTGFASVAFLARYFFISSGTKKQSGCGGGCSGGCSRECSIDKKEIFSKIMENNNNQIYKDNEKDPAARL
jgi:hypothetical protein